MGGGTERGMNDGSGYSLDTSLSTPLPSNILSFLSPFSPPTHLIPIFLLGLKVNPVLSLLLFYFALSPSLSYLTFRPLQEVAVIKDTDEAIMKGTSYFLRLI